jgi:hypothetical protein
MWATGDRWKISAPEVSPQREEIWKLKSSLEDTIFTSPLLCEIMLFGLKFQFVLHRLTCLWLPLSTGASPMTW